MCPFTWDRLTKGAIMKRYLSIFVLALLVTTGVTVFAVQQNDIKVSEEAFATEWSLTNSIPEKEEEVTPEVKKLESLEDVSDHELVSFEKYSAIKTNNYFKYNKICVYNDQCPELIYANTDDVYVKAGTLRKLIKVDDQLKNQGYNLVIWIGYRDEVLQQQLREHLEITMGITEGRYDLVAAPGSSNHQKGTAVDVTLERIDGEPLEMPSDYLDFTDNRLPSLHTNNEPLKVLQEAMEANGMNIYNGEWWHFNDSNREYVESINSSCEEN
jgi:D-alanyl-D-alanine dipeptidase